MFCLYSTDGVSTELYVQDVSNISPKTNLEQVGYKLYIARFQDYKNFMTNL